MFSVIIPILVSVALFLPTLMDGVERKIKARIQSRIGPPILQSWFDIFKLMSKEFYIPVNSLHTVTLLLMYLALQPFVLIYLITSIIHPLTDYDLAITISIYIIIQALFISIPFTIPNPFSIIGASREIMLVIVNELFLIISISLYILYSGLTSFTQTRIVSFTLHTILILLVLFINSYVSSGRPPFDIAEAEPELASGLMIELSGPLLGLLILCLHLKRFFVKLLPVILLTKLFIENNFILLMVSIVVTIIVWILYSVLSAILARSRVDLAPITLLKIYILLVILSVISYVLGI